jgi:hypothetical protein
MMGGIRHQEVNRTTGGYIAQIVQGALLAFVTRGELTAARTRRLFMVAMIKSQVRLREILDIDNALGRVWDVTTWSMHRWLL